MSRTKKKKGLRFLIGLIVILTLSSTGGIFYLSLRNVSVSFEKNDLSPSNEQLYNPYCGWYRTYPYQITDQGEFDSNSVATLIKEDNANRLCLLQMDLGTYASSEISSAGLAELQAILTAWSTTDKQFLLQFTYDSGLPTDISFLYLHVEQIAPVLAQYQSHLYGVIGLPSVPSGTLSIEDETDLTAYYAALSENSIPVMSPARSYTDVVTQNPSIPATRYGIFCRSLAYELPEEIVPPIVDASSNQPIGGYTEEDSTLFDTEKAKKLLSGLHLSYLDCVENPGVIETWKSTTYRGDETFEGLTFYDYITTHLGYRYVLEDAGISFNTWKEDVAQLTITLRNDGFAKCYHSFDTSILLRNTTTEEVITIPLEDDNSTWEPEKDVTLSVPLDVRNYDKGTYSVFLMMRDSSTGEVIKWGNTTQLTSFGYEVGTVNIK